GARLAGLTSVAHRHLEDVAGQHVGVHVLQHDRRRLTAELEGDRPQTLTTRTADRPADRRGAREGDLVDVRVFDERVAGEGRADDQVDDTVRDTGGGHRLHEDAGRDRG